jgi:hypothetical protein
MKCWRKEKNGLLLQVGKFKNKGFVTNVLMKDPSYVNTYLY